MIPEASADGWRTIQIVFNASTHTVHFSPLISIHEQEGVFSDFGTRRSN